MRSFYSIEDYPIETININAVLLFRVTLFLSYVKLISCNHNKMDYLKTYGFIAKYFF